MARANPDNASRIDDHEVFRRTLFFQDISPKTTQKSLRDFLQEFQIERCNVPLDNKGANKQHAIVTFAHKSSIDVLMRRRPVVIDGQEVFIHRRVAGQKALKFNMDNKTLTVSIEDDRYWSRKTIKHYFQDYGKIENILHNDSKDHVFELTFQDYDSVDQILLDAPHKINGVSATVTKGRQDSSQMIVLPADPERTQTQNKGFSKAINFDSHVTNQCIPGKMYCVHVKDIPQHIDAERLSVEFNWPIDSILMEPVTNDHSTTVECWLKNLDQQEAIDSFIKHQADKLLDKFPIRCTKEEDRLELCKKFQNGKCEKTDDSCHWVHIRCTANGTCSADCLYGHQKGANKRWPHINQPHTYRIKITGFNEALTPRSLASQLQQKESSCYVKEKENRIGYIVKVRTFKYAKQLIQRWHTKDVNGQTLKCQMEVNKFAYQNNKFRQSIESLNSNQSTNKENVRRRLSSGSSYAQSSRDTSISGESNTDRSEIRVIYDDHVDDERRLYTHAFKNIGAEPMKSILKPSKSTENISTVSSPKKTLPSAFLEKNWEIMNRATESGNVFYILQKSDRKFNAVIKFYNKEASGDGYRELNALKRLKDVEGVAQLVEPEYQSNNFENNIDDCAKLWVITRRVQKHSLKTIIDRKKERNSDAVSGIELSDAIEFTLNLIGVVKKVHAQGILHQNLDPENIIVNCEPPNYTISQAHVTLLNFTKAYIKGDSSIAVKREQAYPWYQPPQIDDALFTYSASNDASVIVGILFWLITDMVPRRNVSELPHQRQDSYNKIHKATVSAVRTANADRSVSPAVEQLNRYTKDMFDRAFGYPRYEPWTIDDLECRIRLIKQLLAPDDSKMSGIEDISKALLQLNTSFKFMEFSFHPEPIKKVGKVLSDAKQQFLKSKSDQYSWSDGSCTWLNTVQHPMNEYRNDDILTYYWRNQSFPIIITCFANLIDSDTVLVLSIGSPVHGKMIRLPLGQYSTTQDYNTKLQEVFNVELKNLLLFTHNERKTLE